MDYNVIREASDLLSGPAARWVIAHELAHVVSGLRTGNLVIGGVPMTEMRPNYFEAASPKDKYEDAADMLTTSWGFTEGSTAIPQRNGQLTRDQGLFAMASSPANQAMA